MQAPVKEAASSIKMILCSYEAKAVASAVGSSANLTTSKPIFFKPSIKPIISSYECSPSVASSNALAA